METDQILQVKLSQIVQNENSRQIYDQAEMAELMVSMKQHDLLEPIGVRGIGNSKYEIVFGNRRLVAAQKLGWKHIPAIVVECRDNDEMIVLNAVENMQRSNPSFTEQGRLFHKLKMHGLSVSQIAARTGIRSARVETCLEAFYKIPKEIHEKIVNVSQGQRAPHGKISGSSAILIERQSKGGGLTASHKSALYEAAQRENLSASKIKHAAMLMKYGLTPAAALSGTKDIIILNLRMPMERKVVKRLEKRSGKKINNMIYDLVDSEFGLIRPKKIKRYLRASGMANRASV